MSYSLNEVEALCKKAARGAGLSWGMAEEAGAAARWLIAAGLPGAQVLGQLLIHEDPRPWALRAPTSLDGEWRAKEGRLCPLAAGAALSDCATHLETGSPLHIGPADLPVLVLPFAAGVARQFGATLRLSWAGADCTTDGRALSIHGSLDTILSQQAEGLRCQSCAALTDPLVRSTRAQIPDPTWEQLLALAHRTYAPASEESRLLGAGAGVIDAD